MFISRDPIGLMGGMNVFKYAPNPVQWIDPLGLNGYEDGFMGIPSSQYSNMQSLAYKQYDELMRNQMLPCPKSPPSACTNCTTSDKWRKYGGDPNLYHCGFNGFLENRIPNEHNSALTNECFYDHSGNLVDENHEYKGCRGIPDEYPYYKTFNFSTLDSTQESISDLGRGILHISPLDSGGPYGSSETHLNLHYEGKLETNRYFRENPKHQPPNWVDSALPAPVFSGPDSYYGP